MNNVKIGLLVVIGLLLGYFAGTTGQKTVTVQDKATARAVKAVDESVFDLYREGLLLAADAVGCYGESDCLDGVSDKLDGLTPRLKSKLDQRRALITDSQL